MTFKYDEKKTAQENKELFDAYQLDENYDWTKLTQEEKDVDNNSYIRIKLAIIKEQNAKQKLEYKKTEELKVLEEQFHKDEKAIHAKYE